MQRENLTLTKKKPESVLKTTSAVKKFKNDHKKFFEANYVSLSEKEKFLCMKVYCRYKITKRNFQKTVRTLEKEVANLCGISPTTLRKIKFCIILTTFTFQSMIQIQI